MHSTRSDASSLLQTVQRPFVICVMLCVLGYLAIAWLGGGWTRLWTTAPSKTSLPGPFQSGKLACTNLEQDIPCRVFIFSHLS